MGIIQIHLAYSPNLWGELYPRILMVFLYLGPETVMPLASILAAVLGFLLIFWRIILNFFKRLFKRSKPETGEPESSMAESEEYVDPLDE